MENSGMRNTAGLSWLKLEARLCTARMWLRIQSTVEFDMHKLDCMHFFTLHNMTSLWICKTNVELLTEREHLDMNEPAIRGGITSDFESQRFTANNSYIPKHDSTEESCFGFCIDANNINGGVMQLEKLLVDEFAFNIEIPIQEILIITEDAVCNSLMDQFCKCCYLNLFLGFWMLRALVAE